VASIFHLSFKLFSKRKSNHESRVIRVCASSLLDHPQADVFWRGNSLQQWKWLSDNLKQTPTRIYDRWRLCLHPSGDLASLSRATLAGNATRRHAKVTAPRVLRFGRPQLRWGGTTPAPSHGQWCEILLFNYRIFKEHGPAVADEWPDYHYLVAGCLLAGRLA
jgi:hypothetical protein